MDFLNYIHEGKAVNKEPYRSHYVPYAVGQKRGEKSALLTSLNGTWTVRKYDTIKDVPDDFYLERPKKKIPVPSCVQCYGLDGNQYTNVRYPIPFRPPFTPVVNPAYHFKREFNVVSSANDKFIVFNGVDSNFFLYINGKFVGYSLITHSVSEFNVTKYLVDGKNTIDVLVTKWCFGTYLEDQDKFRMTGIIRDVYLLERGSERVVDYRINTQISGKNGKVIFKNLVGATATVKFLGEEKSVNEGESVEFLVKNAEFWSAERPYLYDLEICTKDEVIFERVGIREVKIEDGIFKINGRHVKLLGVNHHDTNPDFGQSLPTGFLKKELVLMKQLNVNCIRTSHYPATTELYELADEMGFYVVDEADLEAHGVLHRSGDYVDADFDYVAIDERFKAPILMREESLVKRDVNRPCVVIWSLGNESGFGDNFRDATSFVKELDSTRPVHYEGGTSVTTNHESGCLDIVSVMYAPIEEMEKYLADEKETRPYFQCEYSHAMGNSPGDLRDYVAEFYKSDRFIGGCIWEWADHAVRDKKGGLLYGGDSGEYLHDGEFCVDGLVSPERKVKRGALEMKKVYEPATITIDGNVLKITNRKNFHALDGRLDLVYKVWDEVVKAESIPVSVPVDGCLELEVDDFATLVASVYVNDPFVGEYETVREGFNRYVVPEPVKVDCKPIIVRSNNKYFVRAGECEYVLSDMNCALVSAKKNGKEYLKDELVPSVFRPYINNDKYMIANRYRVWHFHKVRSEAISSKIVDGNTVEFDGVMVMDSVMPHVEFTLAYKFYENSVDVTFNYKVGSFIDYLPRIGFNMGLDKAFKSVKYFGYGPEEAYCDKIACTYKAYFESNVDSEYQHDVYPQECGAHYDSNFLRLESKNRAVEINGTFSFSALPYSVQEIEDAKHDFELGKSKGTYVCIDYFTAGVGSGACGPALDKRYWTPANGELKFNLKVE